MGDDGLLDLGDGARVIEGLELPALPELPLADHGLAPRAPQEVNTDPIQPAGRDELVKRNTIGGPATGQDIRFLLTARLLERFVDVSTRSATARLIIHDAEIIVATYRAGSHVFQVLTLGGREPIPEVSAIMLPGVKEEEEFSTFTDPYVERPDHSLVQRSLVGGPGKRMRMYVSEQLARNLLGAAHASLTKRAVIHGAGIVVDTYVNTIQFQELIAREVPEKEAVRTATYHVLTLVGRNPRPEDAGFAPEGGSVGGY